MDGNNVVVKNLRSGDTTFIDIPYRTEPPFTNSLGVAVDLNATVKMKINDIQTVQLEPGATLANKYPSSISGNTVNRLPIQSNDTNYVEVVNIVPPSAETGRSKIGIGLSSSVKKQIDQCSNHNLRSCIRSIHTGTYWDNQWKLSNIMSY